MARKGTVSSSETLEGAWAHKLADQPHDKPLGPLTSETIPKPSTQRNNDDFLLLFTTSFVVICRTQETNGTPSF